MRRFIRQPMTAARARGADGQRPRPACAVGLVRKRTRAACYAATVALGLLLL